MKTALFSLAVLGLALVGCSSAPDTKAAATAAPKPAAQSEFETKMQAMTPEQRAAYVSQHPDEVKGAYGLNGKSK